MEGVRERKRRETLQRIVEAGMRLFIRDGYDATTLDDIAAAAGISRRTFFHHLRSKDDILLALQSGTGEMLAAAVRAEPPGREPIDVVRDAAMKVCATFPADEMIAIDRLMRSSEAVQARKQASYVLHEETLYAALRERWPQENRAPALRLVAMVSIGAIRLALETLGREDGRRALALIVEEAFDGLRAEVTAGS